MTNCEKLVKFVILMNVKTVGHEFSIYDLGIHEREVKH